MDYFIELDTRAGAGDHVCLLSACREFIRRTGNTVYSENLPDVIAAYQAPNLRYGKKGIRFRISPKDLHREGNPESLVNYYGTFLGAMGLLRDGEIPKLELPKFDETEPRVVFQPYSVFAENPPLEYLQGLVDSFREMTGMEVYAVGRTDTPQVLKNVEYSLLQDGVAHMMRVVQSASFVLAPRSLLAHLAAGYGKSAFVWTPKDGENWHLNYSGWDRVLHSFKEGPATEVLRLFLKSHGML